METKENTILETIEEATPQVESDLVPAAPREKQSESLRSAIRPVGKVRSPISIIILTIVTFGIYPIIYLYSTFDELKNWRNQGWSGGLYLIFTFIFPFPLIAIPWLIPAYVGRMYDEDEKERPVTGHTGFWALLPIAGAFVWLFKVQGNLNSFWESKGVSV